MDAQTPTLTFVFTDLEGSTRLWESDPARMAQLLARHDALCRTVVATHGGRLVKMIGDGLHAVFVDPAAAVAAALALQRGMASIAGESGLAATMRCGLHAGTAQERDADFFGSAVNRAARLMAAAHGGQVLLSQAVVDRAREHLPAGASLVALGRVRLRDLTEPVDVWQLAHAELRAAFPPLRSLETTPNNLPLQLTSFIGRERDIAAVRELVGRTRLLTLTGTGGCGKTRLALQVAAEVLDDYADGAWLVDLAPLADPGLVTQTVAAVLGLREEPGRDLALTLARHLQTRHVLLVLDNAEHLLHATAHLAATLLRQCPEVQLLVTSREVLRIAGEHTYPVPTLAVPDPGEDAAPERLAGYEAVRLFVERAQAQRADFALTARSATAIGSICRRLDGIPLALELAAARVRSLAVQEIDRRLDERFRLLTGGARAALPRQQTLRALIDWSYDLLAAKEKALLCRAGIFAGGWTLEAAEHVCAGEGIEAGEVLDVLTTLVERSLVMVEEHDDATRYRLLETVRHYALDRLRESAAPTSWHARHLDHFRAFAEEAEPQLSGATQRAWLARLEVEHDNLRGALKWSAAAPDRASDGLRLAAALWWFWEVRGYVTEGRNWLATLLDAAPRTDRSVTRARALNGAGTLARDQGDYRSSQALHEESLAIFRELGDRRGVGATLNNLANVFQSQGSYAAARVLHSESLAIRRELGDRKGISASLNNLGNLAREQADFPSARGLFQESLEIDRSLGDLRGVGISLSNLGGVAEDQGDYAAARALHEEALEIRRKLGDKRGIASSLSHLGHVLNALGNPGLARTMHEEGLAIRRELGDRKGIATALNNLGSVASESGDLDGARALHEESLVIQRGLGDKWGVSTSLNYLGEIACGQGNRVSARTLYRESLAISHELGDRWGIAETLRGLGHVELASRAFAQAACYWGAAERLREEIGMTMSPVERRRYDASIDELQSVLGDELRRHWERGRAMSLEEATDYALQATADGTDATTCSPSRHPPRSTAP